MEKLEQLLELGGIKKDVTFLVISGIAVICSLLKWNPLPLDMAWVAVVLCGIPIILEAVIGLVTAFDIKADVLVSLALIASICIGETLEERRSGAYKEVLKGQIEAAAKVCKEKLAQCIIAYEPVWAIGTGVIPTIKEIEETHRYIHDVLAAGRDAGDCSRILYGGSVNANNVKEIASVPHVDGFLIGGAGLKVESFKNIIKQLSLDGCL